MPAGLPGSTLEDNQDNNPDEGRVVIFDPLSGPKGGPFDAKVIDYDNGSPPGWDVDDRIPILIDNDDASGVSTGALQTGIGFGAQVIGPQVGDRRGGGTAGAPVTIFVAGFNDNGIPGEEFTYAAPPPPGVVSANGIDSTLMYIGGGRSEIVDGTGPDGNGWPEQTQVSSPDPYTAGIAIVAAGQGQPRDGGAGPAFTGFPMQAVTATGAVAAGAAIEAGVINASGVAMVAGESAHGISETELAAAS